ncbi:uncharacterized protein [Periplaneta americana]|uniref:uncharacterized protein isoform X1 n=1 Tax=Periplaneta americana TaxID=6978 RepID=UPI0037E89A40
MRHTIPFLCAVIVTALPSASSTRTVPVSMTWSRLLRKTWKDVARQIDITLRHHEHQHYDAIFKGVQTVSGGRGYVPSWIPGKGDVHSLKWLTLIQHQPGVYILKLHRDLQKYAIILDEIARGENEEPALEHMMISTKRYLNELMRLVERALVTLHIGVPVPRMSYAVVDLHEPPDSASRAARDWTVLTKYRRYLRQWVRLWCRGDKRRKQRKGPA